MSFIVGILGLKSLCSIYQIFLEMSYIYVFDIQKKVCIENIDYIFFVYMVVKIWEWI